MEIQLKIPKEIMDALKIPADKNREKVLLSELALILYERNMLSFGKARELAGLSKWEFDQLLGQRQIERHYNEENFMEDLNYGKEKSRK